MFFLEFILPFIANRLVETGGRGWGQGGGGGLGGLQPPRFLLKFTVYKLKMIVKRKETSSKKNINHFKFPENYW